jgi:hypothetical protein
MENIGEVKSTSGRSYDVRWNSSTGEIRVGGEAAGSASTKDQAMRKADFYATTGQQMRD